ncbi:DUF7482 domain-containing protein [Candidatus Nitrosocosmicus hydrocola]|uniref:DUF7482 domain-containing protein n=1 Tax=Candidatus Nitrosocosmicus hydrocola TaxID=1826872 RepID=UPI000B1A111E|nr:hypothetical protein [Candidatus Nitrosocosmicus hydrocola]
MSTNNFFNRNRKTIVGTLFFLAVFLSMITMPILSVNAQTNQSQSNMPSSQLTSSASVLKLANTNVPIDIPLLKGYENGNEIYFIATDVSDKNTASLLTNKTGFKVNYAPILSQTPESAKGQVYVFTNGINGNGSLGFQNEVMNAKPGDKNYSPLFQVNLVSWNEGATNISEIKSVGQLNQSLQNNEISINKTDIIVNHPAIKWSNGSLMVREDSKNINDETPYMGGQVLDIDTEKMIVTMVAHRGWGPDGSTIYYIVTDAAPKMPADMMGVPFVEADSQLVGKGAVDLFQFTNGINGSGPMGFQAGIGAANPTDENYSPMWFIQFIEWKDPSQTRVLQTLGDIASLQSSGAIEVTPAMDGKHVVNCPFFDEETVLKHKSKQVGL